MPLIQSGKTFNDGEQLTAGKLNQMFSDASLSTAGVDGTSIIINANDVLAVRSINSARIDSGAVITDKLPDSTDKTDGVTFAKMQKISSGKILGRTSANDGLIGESFDFKDEDDMSSDSATALASQQSIKAYVDTEVDSVIANNGITQISGTAPYYGIRAWAQYNGTTNTLNASGNISSVTRHGTGDYEFFFSQPMINLYYAISLSYTNEVNNQHGIGFVNGYGANSFRIGFYNAANSGNTMDKSYVGVSVIC